MPTADGWIEQVSKATQDGRLSAASASNIERWLSEPPFAAYRGLLTEQIEAGNWKSLDDAFYKVIEFGTGGRRGRMFPVGTNVLNARTIAESARGLADYVIEQKGPDASLSCAIARDPRHNSPEFAEICARVLAAAGFTVHLFEEPRSTPLLSFAVRHLGCDCGIMITASHNPPSDNGFKCYDRHGNQVVPPDDAGIIAEVKAASDRIIPELDLDDARARGLIQPGGSEVDAAYIAAVVSESVARPREIGIVYTPLHGVGVTSVAAALKADGFEGVEVLDSQAEPDGAFPNVPGHVSNPEIPETMDAAIERARQIGADLVIASDPDADRIGVAVPVQGDPSGEWTTLTGNQIGAILSAFVMKTTKAAGRLRSDHYLVTTLVTSQMARALADREGVRVVDNLLVGFKWIGKAIDAEGPVGFLFGFEESHGYLKGDHVRDKDAGVAGMLFAELAAFAKAGQQTVLEYLDDLYVDVGHYDERLINKTMAGREGAAQIEALMRAFRESPPRSIAGLDVLDVHDYQNQLIRKSDGTTAPLDGPVGDLLIFHLDAPGVRFAARPSGTEPKIKFYLFARGDTSGLSNTSGLDAIKAGTEALLDRMGADIEDYINAAIAPTDR